MPIPTYTPGYPPDGSSLGQTKSTIRNNLDGTFQTLGTDHVNNNGQPGSNPAGYHTIIHQVSQVGTPPVGIATISGVNQVFSGVPGTLLVNSVTTPAVPPGGDTQLYSLSGMGDLYQLTGGVASKDGYAWMGGFLLQWGGSLAGGGQTVPFIVNFPTACLNVQATPVGTTTTVGTTNVFTKSNFTITGSPIVAYSFTWLAIGY